MNVCIVNTLVGSALLFVGALILRLTGPSNFVKPAFLVTLTGYVLIAYGVILFFLGM